MTTLLKQLGAMPTHELASMVSQYLGNKLMHFVVQAETGKMDVFKAVQEIDFIRNSNLVSSLPVATQKNIRELCSSAVSLIITPDE